MKRPVFSQLDRLADYGGDYGGPRNPAKNRLGVNQYRAALDELIREDGRVGVGEGEVTDADA